MRTVLCAIALACCACRRDSKPAATFAIRKVSAVEIARLEGSLPARAAPAEPSGDLRERVRGLVLERAHAQGKMRALELEDLATIGDPAVPVIDALLDEKDRGPEERLSALEALGAIDTVSSADALVKRIDQEKIREPWIRAQAAYQVAKLTSDHVLPSLLAQLKYELDGETVIWIAAALAKHRNYAGLDGLRVLSASGATAEVRADAQSMLARVTGEAGFQDSETLYTAWNSSDSGRRVPRAEPSPRLHQEMWRRIADLAEFDLRRVDDARFALSRSAEWVVDLLVAALHEEDPHVRLHVAQSLERMGRRASAACGELVLALDEPHMASSAAAALGGIGCTDALDALEVHTQPGNDPELRNAAAAALGRLGSPAAIPALRALLAPGESLDLRQAAAQSLVALGEIATALPLLVDCLTTPGADAGGAESALEAWLANVATRRPKAATLLEQWKAMAGDPAQTPPPAEVASRLRARCKLLRNSMPALVSPEK
jgi:HEAT repeat protein